MNILVTKEKREGKLMEVEIQLEKNETGNALILLDQALEMCLRDECAKYVTQTETKQFSKWGFADYVKFLDSRSLLTRGQKSDLRRIHGWRNKVYHNGLEPKKELVEEALKTLQPFVRYGLVCATTIMNKPVVGVGVNDPLCKATSLMKDRDFSQLPVFDRCKSVGSISERTLLDFIDKNGKPPSRDLKVGEIMDKPFPFVREDTPLLKIVEYLRLNHAILVTTEDRMVGIITKANLLELI